MGWIEKRAAICYCPVPDGDIRDGEVGEGSTWQCDECGQVYRVVCDQFDGWVFVKVYTEEQGQR